jgi:surface antigen Omp85-like protein
MRLVLLVSLLIAADAAAQQDPSDAYLDERARTLVQQARARWELVDASITNYQALVKERVSANLRMRMVDRLVYRRESASRVDWQRGGPIHVTALGAREVIPGVTPNAVAVDDLDFLPELAFDPTDVEALMRIDTTALIHPMAAGGEKHYRFRTGDSTTINLKERTIKLVELRVEPRRRDVRLITGSFWIDDATHAVVQVVFGLAKEFELEMWRDSGNVMMADRSQMQATYSDSSKRGRRGPRRVPLAVLLPPVRAELQHFTIAYGLMHLRWWLPRLISASGVIQVGAIRAPMQFERSYSYDRVLGDTLATLIAKRDTADSTVAIPKTCRVRATRGVKTVIEGDSAWSARYRKQLEERHQRLRARSDSLIAHGDTARARRVREAEECGRHYTITIRDSMSLVTSTELPPSIYGDAQELTGAEELRRLAELINKLPLAPWQMSGPMFSWGPGKGLMRYNKVEGLSIGARAQFDFGRLRSDLTAHFGSADLAPKAEVGVTRSTPRSLTRLGLYRRLNVMDEASGFGGLSASFDALFFGEDDRDYFRTTGIELGRRPAETRTQWYELGIFAEQQRGVARETNFSIAHVINRRNTFQPNLAAQFADQMGGHLTLRTAMGQNPARFRWNGDLTMLGSLGSYDFTRGSARLLFGIPLPARFAASLEGAAGTSTGDVPVQSLWFLGGPSSVRGYDSGEASGTAFWRARAELGSPVKVARLVGFTDLGWAGDRDQFAERVALLSVGAGASLLDGIIRLDVARALRGQRAWRLHLTVNAPL